ncbi:FERM domain-containing protein 8 isoform X3 [Vespa velutina]|uniref:FERM domain-containing protein 8 isoform X3 n=1 Tax=Vespa velutina TaxID=202808 RepID=UPI001FB43BEA|nr:FERM domain-containing protein 8 isoform X3 [Vespa velutina]XP_047369329.1 FERM domain-containing protein 8 isoform X3 [Vespa velutina]XP_047369330.1 FERM domain-containing protein 8 isoform X3 [Vespa velutina]
METQEDCSVRRGQLVQRYPNDYKNDGHASLSMMMSQAQYMNTGRATVRIAVYLMTGVFVTMEVEQSSTAQQILTIVQTEGELGLARAPPLIGQPVFALWLCSSQLEIQLRPNHKPIELAAKWNRLVKKYGSQRDGTDEEPLLYFRRNVFLSRYDEEQIKEAKVLELLYAEARHNVLQGRYPCEGQARYASLGALQARIEIGPYNSQTHTLAFFRRHRGKFLPHHYTSPSLLLGLGLGLGLVGGKGAPEARLLEQYKRIPNHTGANTNPRKLIRKYLEFCWGLPCYGAAFFQGQIERPVRGLASWITNRDLQVLIAINTSGVYIVDDMQCSLLLGLKYSELSWEMAKPSDERNPDCLPCLFLQFPVRENGARVYKILQVFSRQIIHMYQAIMMDTLISGFAEENRNHSSHNDGTNSERQLDHSATTTYSTGSFTNKLSKFTLATFDDEGRCIGQMGSWSFQ